jgi:hypothetical protein
MDATEERRRFFQGLLFAQDKRSGNPDSNFYAFPLPLIPIMDWAKKEIVKVLELATGGKGDSLTARTTNANVIDHCKGSEYVPELLPEGPREGLKPLHVVQPDGPVSDSPISTGKFIANLFPPTRALLCQMITSSSGKTGVCASASTPERVLSSTMSPTKADPSFTG